MAISEAADHGPDEQAPRLPVHKPIAPAHRRGAVTIGEYDIGDHLVWVATDAAGIVALANSEDELVRVLDDFDA
jgi:hypothetical protein